MKILHLADLHIGKKVNDFCMLNEQKYVLSQALDLIQEKNIEALLISGDIFDKGIPSIASLELFENFLCELNKYKIKVFIISGNHDNMDRLSYLSKFLEYSNIFISKSYNGKIDFIPLNKNINIYLLPYLYPALVKKFYPNTEIKNYNDAIRVVLENVELDENKTNIILSHQFVIGKSSLELSQSERKSVGGIDEVDYKNYSKFDYVALGHLHCAQKCGLEKIRYAGSILKYSFSEINQEKKFVVLNIGKNKKIKLDFYPIKFLHEMKEYRGFINDFLNKEFYKKIKTDDYIHFILEDEYVIDAKKKLSLIYPNIMLLEFDNSFTKNLNSNYESIAKDKTILEHFKDFYKIQTNQDLDEIKENLAKNLLSGGIEWDR